ncbi:extracellular elastinolytic metalloproteinase precursor [Stachybotrys elegans]|uniref:Extracellular metalloproteinase n=1 Tax=Stachybotrys elegans TaxID=80388 RepID=A0A8K0WNR0_9HYPO|nr:extracellular elastinolytic metalloproteinase precursor [Stachybotrys elegans]
MEIRGVFDVDQCDALKPYFRYYNQQCRQVTSIAMVERTAFPMKTNVDLLECIYSQTRGARQGYGEAGCKVRPRSLALFGFAAAVLPALSQAHPHMRTQSKRGQSSWTQRSALASRYPMPALSTYTDSISEAKKAGEFRIAVSTDYVETAAEFARQQEPGIEFRIVPDYYVGKNGIGHVHLKQQVHGLDLWNGDFKINIGRDGGVFSHGSSFYTGELPPESSLAKRAFIGPVDALRSIIDTMEMDVEVNDATVKPQMGDVPEKYTIRGTTGARRDPEARLLYVHGDQGRVHLAWQLLLEIDFAWYTVFVDAETGEHVIAVVDSAYRADATYEVYPWGVNDPDDGERVVVKNPWLPSSSPYGWHSDGYDNFTTTRGNNGVTVQDLTAVHWNWSAWETAYRPQSPELRFEYPYDSSADNASDYRDASITQLFYTANMYHDVLYEMGFTEEAGNFQVNNGDRGGLGNDFLLMSTQDSLMSNNAVFVDAPEGESPIILMFLFNTLPEIRDSAFDIGIILHEYTHGLSLRLTGGPLNYGCLSSSEALGMSEGWSDFMPTAIRLKAGDTRETDYGTGSWVLGRPGGGRAYPYSTDMDTNPLTYQSVRNITEYPHSVGTVWATMLYDVMWNLIDDHGLNAEDPVPERDVNGVPTDGKFMAMQLVMDGMALQPCQPSLVAARDAIIDADRALTGGQNACALWQGFAKRGLGVGARPGVYVNDFEVPHDVCKRKC